MHFCNSVSTLKASSIISTESNII